MGRSEIAASIKPTYFLFTNLADVYRLMRALYAKPNEQFET